MHKINPTNRKVYYSPRATAFLRGQTPSTTECLTAAITVLRQVHSCPYFQTWSEGWLSGKDRSALSASRYARAAYLEVTSVRPYPHQALLQAASIEATLLIAGENPHPVPDAVGEILRALLFGFPDSIKLDHI